MEDRITNNSEDRDSRKKIKTVKTVLLLLMAVTAGALAYYGIQYVKAVNFYEGLGKSVKETTKEGAALAAPSLATDETEVETEGNSEVIQAVNPLYEMETAPSDYTCETNADPENAIYSDPYYGYERNPKPDIPEFGVDFDQLKILNPVVAGWIYACGGKIDYPVVLDTNEGYYLKHALDGSRSSSGTIFIGYGNSPKLDQFATPIYGHNMKNGTMFMPLLYYSGRGYWLSHPFFSFITESETRIYDIVSVIECAPNEIPGYAVGSQSIEEYIAYIKARSLYDTGIEVTPDDHLIMLITCRDKSTRRQVVIGKLRVPDNSEQESNEQDG